jgi:hypothetical protein
LVERVLPLVAWEPDELLEPEEEPPLVPGELLFPEHPATTTSETPAIAAF